MELIQILLSMSITYQGTEPIFWFFAFVTELGSEMFFIIVIPPIYWCISKKLGFRLLIITALAAYVTTILKNSFKIPRPPAGRGEATKASYMTYSFPSGHAHGTTTFWFYLMTVTKKFFFIIVGIVVIILVSVSRVFLGVHYWVDVVTGIVLGICTVIAFILLDPWITRTAKAWTFQEKLFFGCLPPLLLMLNAILFFPQDPQVLKLVTAILGFILGSVLEGEFIKFKVKKSLAIKIYRTFLGLTLAFLAYFGLSMVLPFNLITCITTSFLGGFTVTFVAPWVFVAIEERF